jgi:hypothetical protein
MHCRFTVQVAINTLATLNVADHEQIFYANAALRLAMRPNTAPDIKPVPSA